MRTGIFVGSFDPFTIGHKSVVDRVLPLFDRVVIGVGVNERKQYMLTVEELLPSGSCMPAMNAWWWRAIQTSPSILPSATTHSLLSRACATCATLNMSVTKPTSTVA